MTTLRERFRLNLLGCNTHFEGDQLDAVMEVFESLGIEEMYKALKLYQSHQEGTSGHYCWKCHDAINKAVSNAEGK